MTTQARILTLADALVEDLRTRQWSRSFELVGRKYVPTAQLEKTDVTIVTVAVANWEASKADRTRWAYDYEIDVGVQYRASAGSDFTQHADECLRLCEEIADTYRFERPDLADMVLTGAAFGGGSGQPYLPDHANTMNQFTGVVRLTFREWRA